MSKLNDLDELVGSLDGEMEEITGRIGSIRKRLRELSETVSGLDEKLTVVTKRTTEFEERLAGLDDTLGGALGWLDELEHRLRGAELTSLTYLRLPEDAEKIKELNAQGFVIRAFEFSDGRGFVLLRSPRPKEQP
jgi:chromosome segregation ATPase